MVLVGMCKQSSDRKRVISADSYFALVEAPKHLLQMCVKFICVIKPCTSLFSLHLLEYFPSIYMGETVTWTFTIEHDEKLHEDIAFCWLDCDGHHFISPTADDRATATKYMWARDSTLKVLAIVSYFSICNEIDIHNLVPQIVLTLKSLYKCLRGV